MNCKMLSGSFLEDWIIVKLHSDKDAFLALLQRVNETTGIRTDILEKDYGHREKLMRIGSDLADKLFSEFAIVKGFKSNKDLEQAFNRMQGVYVFDDTYLIKYQSACSAFAKMLPALSKTVIEEA